MGSSVAILVEANYQDLEVWYPYYRLKEAGHEVVVAGCGQKSYTGKYGYPITVDCDAKDLDARSFRGVVVPGGWAPDRLRLHEPVLHFVREMDRAKRVIASICHGGWVLVSAGICRGREMTGYAAIRDDLANAGARFVDREVVRDGNLVTSRKPDDLPAFLRTTLAALAE